MKKERDIVKKYVEQDPLLKFFFKVFVFEKDAPARDKAAEHKYLTEVDRSNIYMGIMGSKYGETGIDRISPAEREFRRATEKGIERLIYIKGGDDDRRDKKMRNFIKRISRDIIRKRYENIDELLDHVNESLIDFLEERGNISLEPFDSLLCSDASYKDINAALVKDFLAHRAKKRRVGVPKYSVRDFLCKTIKVVKRKDAALKPTNAAVLFFCRNPQDFIPQSSIKLARFRGSTRMEFIDSQELQGDVYKMLDDVEKFFKRNTRLAGKIVEFKRIDIPEYPYEAVREAVINAVAHRDYVRTGGNVQIDIFYDRVEVTSPGKILPGLDIKNLEGVHETRNKVICKIFHETKDMERFGTGIAKMKHLMKEHGLYPPSLTQPGNFFRITFYGPGDKILDLVSSIPEERQIDLKKMGLNERQIEALRLMVNEKKKISNKEYVTRFNVTRKTALRDFKLLERLGYIKAEGITRDRIYRTVQQMSQIKK